MEKELEKLVNDEILTWLPWVGENYEKNNKKILIVGESHYMNPDDQKSIDKHKRIDFTCICINDIGIKKEYKKYDDKRSTKLFPNFHKTIFGNDTTNTSTLWQNVAYYNFVQNPMKSIKSRPSTKEIYDGWDSFFKLITLLKPDNILFIGSEVLNKFETYAKRNKVEHSKISYKKFSENQIARQFDLFYNDNKMQINSIKHCSTHYSIDKWQGYLKEQKIFDFI